VAVVRLATFEPAPDMSDTEIDELRAFLGTLGGFRTFYALRSPDGTRAISLTVWDDETAMGAADDEVVSAARSGRLRLGQPSRIESYEVVAEGAAQTAS
jgi:heme-degrading monooxygenase HmoA